MRTIQTVVSIVAALAVAALAQDYFGELRYAEREVRVTDLGEAPGDPKVVEGEKLFAAAMGKALEKMSVAGYAVDLIFHNEAPGPFETCPARLYRLPKIGGGAQPIAARMNREAVTGRSALFLEHLALHLAAHIRNGDVNPPPMIPAEEIDGHERERRAEYTVFKTVEWPRYREFLVESLGPSRRSALSEIFSLEEHQRWLGIFPQKE